MAINRLTFYIENSQFILASGLQDQSVTPPVYIDNAVLNATLNDSSGNPIPGATNMAGSYVAGSNGNYTFQITGSTFNPSISYTCTLVIDGTYNSGNMRFHCEIPAIVVVRNQGTEV